MKNLDQKIEAIYEQKCLKERIEIHLTGVQKKLAYRKKELALTERKLHQSGQEIETLEKLSIRSLFLKALGNKKEQLERERQTYLMNFLKFKTCKERIEAKTFEIKVLREKLAAMENLDKELKELLKYKKNFIKYKKKSTAKEIILMESNIRTFRYKIKEIEEAQASGKKVIVELKKLITALNKIKSWRAIVDSSGKLYSSYKGKIFAKNLLKEVKVVNAVIDDYIDELTDVSTHYQLDYEQFIKRIASFLENFYDGLISDWIFHKEIKISINLVIETIDKVKRIQAMLENDAATTLEEREEEKTLLERLVVETKLK